MKRIIQVIAIISIIIPSLVYADGLVMPPPNYYIYESDQKAVIFYEKNIETMVVSISFKGNANDFAWLIPTPSKPEVSKSSDELFTSLDELTRLQYDLEQPLRGNQTGYGLEYAPTKAVYVLETKKVDYYDINVLAAASARELVEWLNENGYQFPTDSTYLLQDYIQNGWIFTAVKINTSSLNWQVKNQLKTGHATPLQFKFKSDKIIYPLKISSIITEYQPRQPEPTPLPTGVEGQQYDNKYYIQPKPIYYQPPDNVNVLLYVITDHKQTLPGFITDYAGNIDKETIQKLAYNDDGSNWLKPTKDKYYLTKLFDTMSRAEMTHDLVLRQADNDTTVNAPSESKRSWTPFIITSIIGGFISLILIIILVWQAATKEKRQVNN